MMWRAAWAECRSRQPPVKPTAPAANDDGKVVDLMAALKKSLEGGGSGRERAERFVDAKGKTPKKRPAGRRAA